MHARHPVQSVNPFTKTYEGREKPRRGPGVSNEKLPRLLLRAASRDFATFPIDGYRSVARFLGVGPYIHHEAQLLQAFNHHLGIFAPERTLQRGFSTRESGQDQGPIRNALRTRHRDFSTY